MKKNYNNTRRKLYLPEYGRHIHEMVDYLMTIEDREERNRQAKVVIAVMGNLQPLLRDTADFTHKLWDHLFIMSDFQLDVDSPYPRPTREELQMVPNKLSYSQERIAFKHYGKYVSHMLSALRNENNIEAQHFAIEQIARYMRSKSFEYNQEHPNNEVIIKDIKTMSEGGIEVNEDAINNLRNDYKQHLSTRNTKGAARPTQKGNQNKAGMKSQHNNAKNRQSTPNRKNNTEAAARHNYQK
ncbi:MAG: DUF4290 domain-containing protein [Alistipes sp.]|nr:DUF4290 domain-containing protein [Alistipes sp.]